MPEFLEFTSIIGGSIKISEFGNLLSWKTNDGLDRIKPSTNNRKPRDGYAILYGVEDNPSVIYDVGDDRGPQITPISLTGGLIPENPETARVIVVVEAGTKEKNIFRITQTFTWKASEDSIDVDRLLENISGADVTLIAVKNHSALLLTEEFLPPNEESSAITRANDGGISLALHEKNRDPCPFPPPDDCFALEFSGGSETIQMKSLIARPASPQSSDFKTNHLGVDILIPGESKPKRFNKFAVTRKNIMDWEVTLDQPINRTLSVGQSHTFTTHYEIHLAPQKLQEDISPGSEAGANFSLQSGTGTDFVFGEPGNLSDFGEEARQKWDEKVREIVQQAIARSGSKHFALVLPEAPPDVITWQGNPNRVSLCLRDVGKAMEMSDLNVPAGDAAGDLGRTLCHEEYLEWRTVRNPAGKIRLVEMTTEVQEYWLMLACYEPKKVLELVAHFADEKSVPTEQVYGVSDPFRLSPEARGQAFCEMMFPGDADRRPPFSPYNNGKKAICFLYKENNTLTAAAKLLAFASFPFAGIERGMVQPMNGRDIILNKLDRSFRKHAVESTNSDPAVVGNIARQVLNNKGIALDNPPGIYITHVAYDRVTLPSGEAVPKTWFSLERGSNTGPPRFQRLVFTVPKDFTDDLIDAATGRKIEFGYQLAQLVKVGIYYRVFDKDRGQPIILGNDRCGLLRRAYDEYQPLNEPITSNLL